MPDTRLLTFRRTTLREGVSLAVAAAAVLAVATSSAISVADDRPTSRITMVAEQAPLTEDGTAGAETAAPVTEIAPLPAPQELAEALAKPAPKVYENNLDGWIREALDIMAAKGIPGTYEGIHRNIMRESTGNPQAINLWDSNAAAGIPSKGLLQVIDPTFAAYHVDGTPFDIWNPVSNIVAACNYAAHRYGSMDNVNSAY
ncbi:MAG TPA: transglycosylase SLT domain-containing protein [Nocardia sp.]|uniref:transglycosylase SLT domain-containing protein n=1 Tax=Nocardia TaxID=1817 RepID=UPI002458C6A0|nr:MULTISPECIES: transglycosylase SLT domain-containing protein [Nocardia]HLS76131.1 transglycosylase SLT domain-containing protein [Nocardia sp.]